MNEKEEFLKRILETFKIEAEESIQNMTSNLIELEKNPEASSKQSLIEAIFRDAHSLKGAARSVNLLEFEYLCQDLENVLSALKNKKIEFDSKIFDVLHLSVNLLNELLLIPSENEISDELKEKIAEVSENLAKIEANQIDKVQIFKTISKKKTKDKKLEEKIIQQEKKPGIPKTQTATNVKKPFDETIRVSIKKLDELLFQVEEMLSLKLASIQHTADLSSIIKTLNYWNKEASDIYPIVRIFLQKIELKQKIDELSKEELEIKKITSFFEWANSLIKNIGSKLVELQKFSVQETYNTGLKVETLLDDIKKIISIPFSTILDVFPKTVRDLSIDKGKKVELLISGKEIEIDRRILEEIRSPMLHILRNSIDHGIEKPEVRKLKNKPEKGTINIKVERLENNNVEITFSDDGAGIDLDKLKTKFAKQEKVNEKNIKDISENDLINYIFNSGVSTSEIITDLSGRGLGLSIVQEKIEQVGGQVSVKTEKDKGAEFKIQIPLSLVTFRGVLIRVGDKKFIMPTSKIERVLRVKKDEIKTVENKTTIPFNNEVIPFVYLADMLELPQEEINKNFELTLVLGSLKKQIGFAIDEVLAEEEVLVKKFNKHLQRVKNISGATVLGSGKVVPILNVSDLLKSASKETKSLNKEETTEKEKDSVLVVEDSITSRMLLKNILETAGYDVTTAIDGVEGLTKLKEEKYSLVVSDVDMPRMNGFDLTSNIRSDKILAETPVVLVTSLSKREDREKGMDVGANAYIVKSSFDQTNLLDVVEKLI